jgi:hypothetical protein
MKDFNRRHFSREDKEDTIQVLLIHDDFEDPEDSGDSIPSKMVNQSDNGLYLKIDRRLAPGGMVRIKKIMQEESCFDEAWYIRDGLVTHCEEVDDATFHFGVGVKILRKVIQGHILTSRFKKHTVM